MQLSREARLIAGITLLTVPTIMYGGITLLGILTGGKFGIAPGGLTLDDAQWALFRAGHAHAGVWVVLSLVLQVLLDSATLPPASKWLARVSAPFEIGNEQNMQFFNMPQVDPANYTRCQLIPAASGIRRAARELGVDAPTILLGGFSPVEPKYVPHSMTPLDFLQAVYEHGGQGHFDAIAYHPYTYVAPPGDDHWTYRELERLVELTRRHKDGGRKVWATEVGYATGSGTGQVSEEVAARYTAQTFDQWFALPYAGPLFWYELVDGRSYVVTDREQTFGLLHSGDWSEKPGYGFFLSKLRK